MRPTDCPRCKRAFEQNGMLQREALHLAKKHGEDVARSFVDDALEAVHGDHVGRQRSPITDPFFGLLR